MREVSPSCDHRGNPRERRPVHFARAPRWHRATRLHRARIPAEQRAWLLAEGSLTNHLRGICPGRFGLEVLREGRHSAQPDEARALRMAQGKPALVREVALRCDERALVVARTVIPAATLRGKRQRLARMGSQPLGALLFSDRTARRGPLQLAHLTLRQAGIARPPAVNAPVWGRRAVFHLGGAPLLVNEFFLPDLFALALSRASAGETDAACGGSP